MFTQLETLKKLNFKVIALIKRRVTMSEQVVVARADDQAARTKLLDMDLSPENFTKYSNDARAAQRRRANLEDKLIDIENVIEATYVEMALTLKDAAEGEYPTSAVATEDAQDGSAAVEAAIDGEYAEDEQAAA